MATAATDLATIGSTLGAAHTQAAAPTLAVMPAAADEVSAGVAQLFSQHAQDYHALAGKAAVFHEQFVQNLKTGAASLHERRGCHRLVVEFAERLDSQRSVLRATPSLFAQRCDTAILHFFAWRSFESPGGRWSRLRSCHCSSCWRSPGTVRGNYRANYLSPNVIRRAGETRSRCLFGQRRADAHGDVRQRQPGRIRQRRMGGQQLTHLVERSGADLRR
jgi:hypothetical protein